ncbi:MAG: hypothetical protein ABIQ11_05665 [Saprospiraceae bacterium]
MKKLTCLILIIFLISCNKKDESIITELPECIELSGALKTVRVQNVKNELHYWLNTDFAQSDGPEYVVNINCDTLCTFCGECIPPNCAKKYDFESWVIIWKR